MIDFMIVEAPEDDDYPGDDPFGIKEPGSITFLVEEKHRPRHAYDDALTVEVLEYDGCACWANEGTGLEFWINQYINPKDVVVGGVYTVSGMRVTFYRGDGWTTDDDEEWEYDELTRHFYPGYRIAGLLLDWWYTLVVWPWRTAKERFKDR